MSSLANRPGTLKYTLLVMLYILSVVTQKIMTFLEKKWFRKKNWFEHKMGEVWWTFATFRARIYGLNYYVRPSRHQGYDLVS